MKNPEPTRRTLEHVEGLLRQMADELQELSLPATSRSPFVELQQWLSSQIQAISGFVGQLMRLIARFRNADEREVDIETAVRETLANAVQHGNHEDLPKSVYLVWRCSMDGEVLLAIRDQGRGFDRRAAPDPTGPENLLSLHGHKIYLMQASMDEVTFEDARTVVHIRKKSQAGSAAHRNTQ